MMTSIQSPTSWQMSDRERANLQKVTLYNSVQSLSEIWPLAAQHYNQTIALHDPHAKPEVKFTYA
ncbi:MAG: AMP-dependent synthetase, partial [Okeania sp. SIO2D1]|nr:AMP-dependent synthetase [Okeania sp. SIO2D1]